MIPRIVATPLGALPEPRAGTPRRVSADVLAGILPGPGRDQLAGGPTLVVTTGQQPGLFTGPLYTIYKALSAIALARRLERARGVPVVPVFWVAGDDHDFAEANHTAFIATAGDAEPIVLRERAPDAPLVPLSRELCGPEILAALDRLRQATPDTEFKAGVMEWLEAAYRPAATLADASALAIHALLGPRGLAVFKAYDVPAKRAAAPYVLRGLGTTLDDGLTPVFVEGKAGRDRLRAEGGAFVTRRSEERFTRAELESVAAKQPERLSPNVLLRPAVEAALFPTVAYAAGPGELEYLPKAAELYRVVGEDVVAQTPVPRWSGVLVESKVDKIIERHGIALQEFFGPPGALEARLVREALPAEIADALSLLRRHLEDDYARFGAAVETLDPTLKRTAENAARGGLKDTQDLEKKLIASLKRGNETLLSQVARARAAVAPLGEPQERALTLASFLIRYGPELLDGLDAEVARWAGAS
ncbi:MAG TPA: bacillithiol biosynthesis BshC [Gemmatimonadales bacterium]